MSNCRCEVSLITTKETCEINKFKTSKYSSSCVISIHAQRSQIKSRHVISCNVITCHCMSLFGSTCHCMSMHVQSCLISGRCSGSGTHTNRGRGRSGGRSTNKSTVVSCHVKPRQVNSCRTMSCRIITLYYMPLHAPPLLKMVLLLRKHHRPDCFMQPVGVLFQLVHDGTT